jgi:hypothetical protein
MSGKNVAVGETFGVKGSLGFVVRAGPFVGLCKSSSFSAFGIVIAE